MNPDKFLTDLAALTGCDSVHIEWLGYWSDPAKRFGVWIHRPDKREQRGRIGFGGTGPTVEAAMQEARAKLAAHYEGEPA